MRNQTVRVTIRLTAPSVAGAGYKLRHITEDPAALAYQESLRQEQQMLIDRIGELTGAPLDVKRRFTRTTNAISANVRRRDLELIRGLEGVAGVAEEMRYRVEPPVAGKPSATK